MMISFYRISVFIDLLLVSLPSSPVVLPLKLIFGYLMSHVNMCMSSHKHLFNRYPCILKKKEKISFCSMIRVPIFLHLWFIRKLLFNAYTYIFCFVCYDFLVNDWGSSFFVSCCKFFLCSSFTGPTPRSDPYDKCVSIIAFLPYDSISFS